MTGKSGRTAIQKTQPFSKEMSIETEAYIKYCIKKDKAIHEYKKDASTYEECLQKMEAVRNEYLRILASLEVK